MRSATRAPSGALAPFVRVLFYFEGPELPHTRERVLPTGAMQLLVNLDADELRWWDEDRAYALRGGMLGGARDRPLVIDTAGQRRITGVAFHPGGAASFVADRLDRLGAAHVPIDALWTDGGTLRERLLEASEPEAIFDAWEGVLLEQLRVAPSRAIQRAIEALDAGRRVRDVARELGWSERLLHQRFGERVGLAPKRYARVRRMQRVLHALSSGTTLRGAELAARLGFHDQAHLVRDFRALTGTTPTHYAPRSPGEPNHVVLE